MALQSPGVEVNVIDESFYTPAAPGTTLIYLVFLSLRRHQVGLLFMDQKEMNMAYLQHIVY